jgi:hypothetical protein
VKNAYIHDGSGWQSLKGPPGPSEPSTDAGNTLTVGSDGLLYRGVATAVRWTPIMYDGLGEIAEGRGTVVVYRDELGAVAHVVCEISVSKDTFDPSALYIFVEGCPVTPDLDSYAVSAPASASAVSGINFVAFPAFAEVTGNFSVSGEDVFDAFPTGLVTLCVSSTFRVHDEAGAWWKN